MTLLESLNDDTVIHDYNDHNMNHTSSTNNNNYNNNIEEDDPSFNDLHQLFISSSFSNNDNDNNDNNNNNLNYTEILQQMQR